ncbi:MAG: PHB depolymerase family esterase, partial [bacterium]
MKTNQEMLAKMREATQKLMAGGPAAATAAIQEALQKGVNPEYAAAHSAGTTPESRPMHDINPFHGKDINKPAKASKAAAVDDLVEENAVPVKDDFVSKLLADLGVSSSIDLGQFARPEFFSNEFQMPSFVPQTEMPQEVELDASSAGQFISGSYTNQAGSRSYKLYIPSSYHGQALPLVVMLHGCTQSPDDFAAGTRMNAIAEEKQCFVVYPAQTQSANSSKCWNWFNAIDQQRDQGEPSIIAGITRQIISTQNIDARQVYIAGMSAGGAMAVIMGRLYPDLYTAVGVHSGLPYAAAHDLPSALAAMKGGVAGRSAAIKSHASASGDTAQRSAIPIIVFHGDRDTTVHPRNGEKVMTQSQGANSANAAMPAKPEPIVLRGKIPNGHAYSQTTHQNAEGQIVAE